MSRNLARQTSRDLRSDWLAMVLTAGFYCDSRAHNIRKVRVVKYIVVYDQIKAADQKYCHNQKWRRKTQRNKLTNKRFWRQFRWFLAKILYSRSVFINRINSKLFKRGKEEYAFSVDKKSHERKIRLCTWRDRREFPCGIVINYWRKEVNQGDSAPFAIESYGSTKNWNPETETESRNHRNGNRNRNRIWNPWKKVPSNRFEKKILAMTIK